MDEFSWIIGLQLWRRDHSVYGLSQWEIGWAHSQNDPCDLNRSYKNPNYSKYDPIPSPDNYKLAIPSWDCPLIQGVCTYPGSPAVPWAGPPGRPPTAPWPSLPTALDAAGWPRPDPGLHSRWSPHQTRNSGRTWSGTWQHLGSLWKASSPRGKIYLVILQQQNQMEICPE